MKALILISIFALFISPTYAKKMNQISVTTAIDSTPQEAWDVMVDFKNYGDWNDWVVQLDGEAKIGSVVKAYSNSGQLLKLKITKMQRPYKLCWVDVTWFTKFGLGGWRCRTIKSNPNGEGILFINHFEFTGVFGGVLDLFARNFLKEGMELENTNLKDFLEN
jgi:hypothetical protein